jgi:hypothetical protein
LNNLRGGYCISHACPDFRSGCPRNTATGSVN